MNKQKLDVVIVGELNIDLVLWGVPFPENEKEKLAEDMRFTMGSSSAITAHNLSMVGSRVGFIGKAGKDNFGDYMISGLRAAGVDTGAVIRDAALKTGATIILANPPHKALLTYMGAMAEMTIGDIDWEYVRQARHLHLGCYYLQTGLIPDVPQLFHRARKLGLTTSLDTNWDPSEKWSEDLYQVLSYTDIFFPNEEEAIQIAHAGSLDEAVKKLRKMVPVLAIKRGGKGASVYSGAKYHTLPPFPVKAIETTGAGDSFNAGFIHQFAQGKSLPECLQFATACGALAVTALGGTGAFQNKVKVKKQLDKIIAS